MARLEGIHLREGSSTLTRYHLREVSALEMCPHKKGVRLIEMSIQGSSYSGVNLIKVSILHKCLPNRGSIL